MCEGKLPQEKKTKKQSGEVSDREKRELFKMATFKKLQGKGTSYKYLGDLLKNKKNKHRVILNGRE